MSEPFTGRWRRVEDVIVSYLKGAEVWVIGVRPIWVASR
jgi:hypothetical protein